MEIGSVHWILYSGDFHECTHDSSISLMSFLLDMSHTFMFDVDRFSDTEDYGATYRQIGGNLLSSGEIHRTIAALFDSMLADYEDPKLL